MLELLSRASSHTSSYRLLSPLEGLFRGRGLFSSRGWRPASRRCGSSLFGGARGFDGSHGADGLRTKARCADLRNLLGDLRVPENLIDHLLHAAVPLGRLFRQRLPHDGLKRRRKGGNIGLHAEMLHEDLAHAVPIERNISREQLEENDSQGVNINSVMVVSRPDLRRHVVDGADADRLTALTGDADVLREAIVPNLHVAIFIKDVLWLEVAVDDAPIVQVAQPLADLSRKKDGLVRCHACRSARDEVSKGRSSHILHDHERYAVSVGLDIEDGDQVRSLQVDAVANSAQLDVVVLLNHFQRHLAAAVAHGVVNLPEPAAANAAQDGVPIERAVSMMVSKVHVTPSPHPLWRSL